MGNEYDDIINLPYPEPKNHVRLPIHKRAAQFAPFAALAGDKEAIEEAQRKQEEKIAEIDAPVNIDDDI